MKRALFVVGALLCAHNAFAVADPCEVLGIKGSLSWEGSNHTCNTYQPSYPTPLVTSALPIRDLQLLGTVIVELRLIRTESLNAQAALAAAVKSLADIAKSLQDSNVAWRKDALDKTTAALSAVPARLAEDTSLRTALLESLRESLRNDAAFIEAVRKAP